MTPDLRRAVRTSVHATGAIVALGYLGWIIYVTPEGKHQIIAMGLLLLLIMRELFHGAENVTARIKFNAGRDGFGAEVDPENKV